METLVTITLIIKGEPDNSKADMAELEYHISKWYTRDAGQEAPFPLGSLLFYSINAVTKVDSPS